MASNTAIEWTDHTFNGWIGCTKVSPGCANCYAETLMDTRYGRVKWGRGQPRQRTSEANWKQPLRWNRAHEEAIEDALHDFGEDTYVAPRRPRVFCSSLADWLDDEVPIEWLADLLNLIRRTPNLDWLLLTKRPENWAARMEAVCEIDGDSLAWSWLRSTPPANVWIGTTVEDQTRADERIPALLSIPARVRFLSCEPLLGPVNLDFGAPRFRTFDSYHAEIHWVICGGESGGKARPMHPDWARSLRDQCGAAGVAFFFKQWGEWAPVEPNIDVPASALHCFPKGQRMVRIGKHSAGRHLDGREHSAFPNV